MSSVDGGAGSKVTFTLPAMLGPELSVQELAYGPARHRLEHGLHDAMTDPE
jgi:hypothetical protein